MSATTIPEDVSTDLLAMLQQFDYETYNLPRTPLQESNHARHVRSLEAKLDRLKAGVGKPGDAASLRRWAKDLFDQGAGEGAGWDAAESWVYQGA